MEPMPFAPSRPLAGLVVLLVEPDPVDRAEAREALARAGAEVIEARDGDGALAIFERRHVDVIVGDAALPGTDGLELMRAIRSRPDARWRTPAIAVTASASPEQIRAAIRAGFDGHASKPASWASLVARISHLARAPLLQLAG